MYLKHKTIFLTENNNIKLKQIKKKNVKKYARFVSRKLLTSTKMYITDYIYAGYLRDIVSPKSFLTFMESAIIFRCYFIYSKYGAICSASVRKEHCYLDILRDRCISQIILQKREIIFQN